MEYKVVLAILLLILLGTTSAWLHNDSPAFISYIGTLAFGMLVSVAILYKEQFDAHFLERFCRIGKAVDCNQVLHSPGASIAGISLGELSLFYFATLFFCCTLFPQACYGIAVLCNAAALCFTLYSVVYQIFVVRKGCMLCMLVNIAVWINTAELYLLKKDSTLSTPLSVLLAFALIGCICLASEAIFVHYRTEYQKRHRLAGRLSALLNPPAFQSLLALEPSIKEDSTEVFKQLIGTYPNGQPSRLLRELNIKAIPTNFLLDKESRIIAKDLRGEQLIYTLDSLINQ